MDQALRIAIRQYASQPTPENAQHLARLYLRSLGIPLPSNIPEKWHGNLTYAGLLQRLLQLTDEQLGATVTVYDNEYTPITSMHSLEQSDGVLDAGQPVLLHHTCIRCEAPLEDAQVRQYFENTVTGLDAALSPAGTLARSLATLCQNCIYCTDCALPPASPGRPHSCPAEAGLGCPCCERTRQQMGLSSGD